MHRVRKGVRKRIFDVGDPIGLGKPVTAKECFYL